MNNYPTFPQQQQQFSPSSTAYPTQYQPSYAYPPTLPQQLQHSSSQQAQLHSQQQQQSSFFQSLPQGTARQYSHQQTQLSAPLRQQPAQTTQARNESLSLPSTPGNGPGAPPPDPSSPPGNSYEEQLMNALRQEAENGNVAEPQDNEDNVDEDDAGDPDDPVYQLPPPPEAVYANEVELEEAMHAWTLEHGYELVRRASKKNAAGQLYKRYYHCSKHGRISNYQKTTDKAKQRNNRKSSRMGCPMSLAAVAVDPHDPSGNWQIRHRKTHHNHPAVDAITLAGHRRRARAGGVEKAVDGLFAIGTNTRDVLKFLQRTNPDGLFNRTDVANMKLKYKKFGTCAQRPDDPSQKQAASSKSGFPSACDTCRQKKGRCDSVRPVCGPCLRSNISCHYDHDPHPRAGQPEQSTTPQAGPSKALQSSASRHAPNKTFTPGEDHSMVSMDTTMTDTPGFRPHNSFSDSLSQTNNRSAEQVLAALANFQQEHVKPTKLFLESSSVETLASSTCGNGDAYKGVTPRPFGFTSDWRQFKDKFFAAAIKENTHDVLTGDKKEPQKPLGEDVSVEDHNEYIKQLAIFKRRNEMLRIAIKECLQPALWSRVHFIPYAHDIWNALEDICMPRGSENAYHRFIELNNITLQACGSMDQYLHSLENKYAEFNQIASYHDTRRVPSFLNQSYSERLKRQAGGNGAFPDEMLCFVFLKNLGPQHQNIATNLTKKNNIGGYGSGDRVGFKELTALVKKAVEWEASKSAVGGQRKQ